MSICHPLLNSRR